MGSGEVKMYATLPVTPISGEVFLSHIITNRIISKPRVEVTIIDLLDMVCEYWFIVLMLKLEIMVFVN